MASADPPPQLLVVEDDLALQSVLHLVLADQGYAASVASSVEQALRLVHRQPFDLILTELFTPTDEETVAYLLPMRKLAHGISIVVVASWLTTREVEQQGFNGPLSKPFGVNDLIMQVAAGLNRPFSAMQLRQAEVAKRYVTCLIAGDIEALVALCTEQVRYYPWVAPPYPAARPVTGHVALRAHLQEMFRYFRHYTLELAQLYPCPYGIAARLLLRWRTSEGALKQQIVGLCFQSSGEQISQVGIPIQDEHLRTLLGR
jgi:CheY-like chemotaxis protein